jgi:hypothetical protein
MVKPGTVGLFATAMQLEVGAPIGRRAGVCPDLNMGMGMGVGMGVAISKGSPHPGGLTKRGGHPNRWPTNRGVQAFKEVGRAASRIARTLPAHGVFGVVDTNQCAVRSVVAFATEHTPKACCPPTSAGWPHRRPPPSRLCRLCKIFWPFEGTRP